MSYKDDILQKLIENSERGNLPPLQDERATGIIEKIKEGIKEAIRSSGELIRSLFGDTDFSSTWGVIKAIVVIAAVVFAFYIIFLIVKRISLPNSALRERIFSPTIEYESDLEALLKEAIANSNWKRAMRIRWLIFTQKQGLPSSYTPLMYARKTEQSFNETVYKCMFGKLSVGAEEYEAYNQSLEAMGGEAA